MNSHFIFVSLLFLVSFSWENTETAPGIEFTDYRQVISGYLIGVTVRKNRLPHLLGCVKDDPTIQAQFSVYMDRIEKLNFDNLPVLAEVFADLFLNFNLNILDIDSCAQKEDYEDRIFQKIYSMMQATVIKRLMLNFISNSQMIFKDINDAVDNYRLRKFELLGQDLGDIMHLLLTYAAPAPSNLPDYLQVIKGLLIGLNYGGDIDSIIKCIHQVPEAFNKLIKIINDIKHLNIKNIQGIIDELMKAFASVKEIMKSLESCAGSVPEFKELVKKLSSVDILKMIEQIKKNLVSILANLIKVRDALVAKKYEELGKALGTILYQILLDTKLFDSE